jgi:tRNA (guanine-N7-)-methyltransferase
LTSAQERALRDLWPTYGREFSAETIDLERLFGRSADKILEIGFGDGETLVQQAANHPEQDYLGIEVHRPGIGHCLLHAEIAGITNLRIFEHDATEVLTQQIADASLSRINLYFPDPWPKKRHHKRRILQRSFLELAARKIAPAGSLHIATDWKNYAEHIDELVNMSREFEVTERREHAGEYALDRATTRFERRGLNKGHRITDWRLQKN